MASIKNNLFYNFILSLSQVMIPLVSIPLISRMLDPVGIGKVSFIDSFTYYFITIAEFGIMVYGIREVARNRNDKEALQKVVSELLVLHLLSSAVTILIYSVAVFFIWSRINDTRLLFFSFSFLLVNSFACEWYFLGMERFRYITIRSLFTRVLALGALFILIKAPPDYYLYYGIMTTAACCNGIWNTASLFSQLPVRFKNVNWRKHIKYTKVTYGISLLYSVTIMLDNVFLRLASTLTAVAFYSFTLKIVRLSSLLLSDSLQVFFPRIVSLLKEEKAKQVQETILKSIQLIIFLVVPLCMGLFLLSDELVQFYLGESFSAVAVDLKIVAAFPLLKTVSLFISKQVLVSHNSEKLFLKSLLVGCIIFFIIMPILSYHFADRGACVAIMITEFSILALNYYFARKVAGMLKIFDFAAFLEAVLSALLFIPIVYLLKKYISGDLAILFWSVSVCFITYFVAQTFIIKNKFALYLKSIVMQYASGKPFR